MVMFLLSYVPLFTAFLKLRKIDQTERVLRIGAVVFIAIGEIIAAIKGREESTAE